MGYVNFKCQFPQLGLRKNKFDKETLKKLTSLALSFLFFFFLFKVAVVMIDLGIQNPILSHKYNRQNM